MEQLTFELAVPEPPGFANFVIGRNAEAVATLRAVAAGRAPAPVVFLWGAPGAGCSHLLRAVVAGALEAGHAAVHCAMPAQVPTEPPEAHAVVVVDDIDRADAEAQRVLFTLHNRLADSGGALVVASPVPPVQLGLRADLRTRLAAGLVHEVFPLADAEKPQALAAYARARGMHLADEVIAYLLVHGRRDMPSLLATLAAIDRQSLAAKRPVTVPLLRAWLQHALALEQRR